MRAAGLIAGALLATALAAPSPAAAPTYQETQREYIVATKWGGIHLSVAHPTVNGTVVKAPAVLTYSPYYGSLETRLTDSKSWTKQGYVRVAADVVGTGDSGGCFDYGGIREKETGYAIVEWIAKQPWSTGKVGMIGGSYDGTTAMATAVTRPPHLTTIVPEAAISRWYDYAYSGGIRYTVNNERFGNENPGLVIDEQGFDTPVSFDFGLSTPPPLDYNNPDYQNRVITHVTPCDQLKHIQNGYSNDPDYGPFWLERDYAKDAGKVTIPVLVSGNWGDWNVKQDTQVRYWKALTHSKFARLYMGTRWNGHGTPAGDYPATVQAWMDHWLKGAKNGLEHDLPPVVSQTSDSKGKGDFLGGPVPSTTDVVLYAQNATVNGYGHALLPTKPSRPGGIVVTPVRDSMSYTLTDTGTESGALAAARTGKSAAWFESPTLRRDVRIFGSPTAYVWSSVQRSWMTVAVSVVDIDPANYSDTAGVHHASQKNALIGVTRGWLDSRYRNGLAKRVTWKPGENGLTVVAKPQDYIFRKGHAIGLLVMSEQLEWTVAKPYDDPAAGQGATVTVDTTGKTLLHLPIVGVVNPKKLFG